MPRALPTSYVKVTWLVTEAGVARLANIAIYPSALPLARNNALIELSQHRHPVCRPGRTGVVNDDRQRGSVCHPATPPGVV